MIQTLSLFISFSPNNLGLTFGDDLDDTSFSADVASATRHHLRETLTGYANSMKVVRSREREREKEKERERERKGGRERREREGRIS